MPTHESTRQRICLYTGTASAKEIKTLQAALVDADKEWAQALDAKEREVAKLRAELSLQTAAATNTATVMLEGGQKGKASEAKDPGDAQTVAALQEVAALKAALTDAKELAREQRALLAKQLANDRELGLACQQIVVSAPAAMQAAPCNPPENPFAAPVAMPAASTAPSGMAHANPFAASVPTPATAAPSPSVQNAVCCMHASMHTRCVLPVCWMHMCSIYTSCSQ